ncbi:MAG: hypothetical protein ABI782_11170 [Anaerolineaceae bacterium]
MSGPTGHFRQNVLLAALGSVAVLIVGVSLWARSTAGESDSSSSVAAVQPAAVAAVPPAPDSTLPGTARNFVPTSQAAPWVYIVGSDAEAAELQTAAASIPAGSEVIVVGSTDEANALESVILGLNPASEAGGAPPVRVMILGSLASGR